MVIQAQFLDKEAFLKFFTFANLVKHAEEHPLNKALYQNGLVDFEAEAIGTHRFANPINGDYLKLQFLPDAYRVEGRVGGLEIFGIYRDLGLVEILPTKISLVADFTPYKPFILSVGGYSNLVDQVRFILSPKKGEIVTKAHIPKYDAPIETLELPLISIDQTPNGIPVISIDINQLPKGESLIQVQDFFIAVKNEVNDIRILSVFRGAKNG